MRRYVKSNINMVNIVTQIRFLAIFGYVVAAILMAKTLFNLSARPLTAIAPGLGQALTRDIKVSRRLGCLFKDHRYFLHPRHSVSFLCAAYKPPVFSHT